MFANHLAVGLIMSFIGMAIVAVMIIALARQHESDIYNALRLTTWATLPFAQFLSGGILLWLFFTTWARYCSLCPIHFTKARYGKEYCKGKMNSGKRHQGKGAIEILEEAVHALRIAPAGILACYYIGSLPFILALLYFWTDMSRSGLAEGHCPAASMGLAVLFIWMKWWHAVFTQKVKAWICRERASRYPFRRIVHLIASQTLIQASGLVVLPLAALFAIPFGWCYAFYQNVSVLDDLEDDNARSLIKRSWKQTKLWPGQNHILLTVFFVLGFIVFINRVVAQ